MKNKSQYTKNVLWWASQYWNKFSWKQKAWLIGLLALTWVIGTQKLMNITDNTKVNIETVLDSDNSEDILDEKYNPSFKVKWRKYSDLYAGYLWYFEKWNNWRIDFWSTQIWDKIEVPQDVNELMDLFWKKKFQRKNTKGFTVAKNFYDNTIKNIDFNTSPKSSISEYKNDIKTSIWDIVSNFDFDQSNKDFLKNNPKSWSHEKQELWEDIVKKIDENVILSYNMTEFFPQWAPWGKMEYRMLNHILKQYGEDFVFHVPAVYDDYASFGSYQFTSFAVYDTPERKEWASIMNQYVDSKFKIPGSVTKLQWNDHHRAAVLFAMYNLRRLIVRFSENDIKDIKNDIEKNSFKSIIAQIIAIGHNYPADLKYVSKILSNSLDDWKFYEEMKWRHTYQYAKKTYWNYNALLNGVEYDQEPKIIYIQSPLIIQKQSQDRIKEDKRVIDSKIESKKSDFVYLRRTTDWNYKVYSYIIKNWWNVGGVKNVTRNILWKNISIIVTDNQWNEYKNDTYFTKGTKVYVKIRE